MEPATTKAALGAKPAPEPAAPKLLVERFADGGITCLKFGGMIDESFEGKKLGASVACETLVLDLGGVKKISSFGIREWVDFVTTATKQARTTILIECAPKVVDQLNMVANFTGGGRVFSFYAPFRCDYCDSEHRVLLQVDRDMDTIKTMKLAERPCPACNEGMYFDDDGATFFSYIIGQDKFSLEPEVAAFLASKLDYAVAEGARKLKVDKVIEGRTTFLRLAGDLDRAFPRDKLAEGLEGTVILDVSAVGKIEPAGAAEWRSFIQMITPGVEQLYLFGVQPAFLEKLCSAEDLGKKAQVLSFALPYACKTCGTSSAHALDVGTHHAVLAFATAPEVRCQTCKVAMTCTATDASMALLPGLPKPTATPEMVKSLGVLRERALAISKPKRPAATTPQDDEKQRSQPQGRSPVVWIAALLGIVVVALGAIVIVKVLAKDDGPTDKGRFGIGPIVETSDQNKPDAKPHPWVGKLGLGQAEAARDKAGSIVAHAASSVASSQDDAENEAMEAALDAFAFELQRSLKEPKWFSAVPGIYESARSTKLAALARDPQSTQARREVREARQVTAYRLRNDGVLPAITDKFRETYQTPEGRRYVAYVEITIFADNIAELAKHYEQQHTALGATLVPMFPLLGWRYPVDHGGIVIAVGPGPLKDMGIAERNVLLTVDGRDPPGVESFAKIATDEYAALVKTGGTFRLEVQAGDGAKKEFTTKLEGEKTATPAGSNTPRNGSGKTGTNGGTTNTGNPVNTWDRVGGGKGSGRDDPTQ